MKLINVIAGTFIALFVIMVLGSVYNIVKILRASESALVPVTQSETIQVPSSNPPGNVVSERLNTVPANVPETTKKQVQVFTVNKDRVIYLNSEVSFGLTQQITNQIKTLNATSKDAIWLLIDSPGGSVLDGATVISQMEASKAPVYTVCTRLCASMAAMIHAYGSKRYMTDRSILMFHPASGQHQGQVPNMVSELTTLTRYLNKMMFYVVSRSKLSQKEFDSLVPYTLWIDSDDAVDKSFADAVISLNVPYSPTGGVDALQFKTPTTIAVSSFMYISPNQELWGN